LMDVVCYLNLNAAMKFLMISLKHKRAIGI
jgi:hypothetical protein